MKVNGIEVEVCGPYMEPHAPFGRVTFTSEERHCFWLDKGKKRSCGITKTADGRFVSGTFSEMPLAKTVRGSAEENRRQGPLSLDLTGEGQCVN